MGAKKRSLVEFKLIGSILLISFLVACVGKLGTYEGSWVVEDNRISLQDGGPHQGNWQTRDVAIAYTYQQNSQHLKITGDVQLGRYLTTGFNTLEYFTIDIYMLDADGIVLSSKLILNYGYRRNLDFFEMTPFDDNLVLPADTAAIAFGYRGRVTEGGGSKMGDNRRGEQIAWNFWKVSGRRPSD